MIRVISYGTNKQAYFDLFIESCIRYNIEPVIIGWGEPWIGFGKKLTDIRDYASSLPEDEVILVVDPFDVIFLCGLDEIEEKFIKSGTRLLCGALKLGKTMRKVYNVEFNKTGRPTPATQYGYDSVNVGTWITTAGYAVTLINRFVSEFGMTPVTMDQDLFTAVYINNPAEVSLDWSCEIFHNLFFKNLFTRKPNLEDIEFRDGRIYNTSTGTYPCVVHASGNTFMEKLGYSLGYGRYMVKPVKNNINFMKKAVFHVRQLRRQIVALVLIVAMLIVGWIYFLRYILIS
jgi:hypothetical protein